MRSKLTQAVVATSVFALVSVPKSVTAEERGCHTFAGRFTAVTVACPDPSLLLCTHGTLRGDLEGTYDFEATGVTETGALTGHSIITLENGAMIFGNDVSVLNPDGTFVTTVTIVGGTRQFEHATGTLTATGSLTATGTEGTYIAEICLGAGSD